MNIISQVLKAYLYHLEGDDIKAAVCLQNSGQLGKNLYIKLIKGELQNAIQDIK